MIPARLLLGIALGLVLPNAAIADDEALPGVSQPDPIVTVAPPEPDDQPDNPGTFKVGNTDVRISGSVTIDITAGDVKPRSNR